MTDEFTCSMCRNTFNKGRSDEEAIQEAIDRWERNKDLDPLDNLCVVCDDCMNKLREQFPELRQP